MPHKSKTLADVHSRKAAVLCAFQEVAGQIAAAVCLETTDDAAVHRLDVWRGDGR